MLDYRPPRGESLRDVRHRLRAVLEALLERPERRILIIGHDVTQVMVRAVTGGLGDAELVELMGGEPVRNAAIGHWRHTDRWRLVTYNDTSHIPPIGAPLTTKVGTS